MPGPGPLARCVGLGFKFVDQLIELVEIDPGPEPECVRNGFRRRTATQFRRFTETGAQRAIDDILEREAEFARAPFQQRRQIIVDGERSAHNPHHGCGDI